MKQVIRFTNFLSRKSKEINFITLLPRSKQHLNKYLKYQERQIRHNCVLLILLETFALIVKILMHFVLTPYESE